MTKKPIYKRSKFWIFLSIIVLALFFFLRPSTSEIDQDYVIEVVKRGNIDVKVTANGSVANQSVYSMVSRINAKILEVKVKEGDRVTVDQELIKLDDTDLQSALRSAEYSFNSAVYARDKLKNAPITDDYAIKQAQQQVNLTWNAVESAKRNLSNAIIKSPIDGVVLSVNAKVNDFSSLTSMAPLMTIGSLGEYIALLNVNELDISKVQLDQDINLKIDALDKEIVGKVKSIATQGINLVGIVNFSVQATIPDQEMLKPLMSIDGEISVKTANNVLILPAAAIREKSGRTYCLTPIFDDSGKLINAQEKDVEIGVNNNSEVEILSGLNEGDQVVLNFDLNSNSFNFGFGSTN